MYVTTDRVFELDNSETKCYEMTKQLYLSLWASNQKDKTTSFHKTSKVEGKKWSYFHD